MAPQKPRHTRHRRRASIDNDETGERTTTIRRPAGGGSSGDRRKSQSDEKKRRSRTYEERKSGSVRKHRSKKEESQRASNTLSIDSLARLNQETDGIIQPSPKERRRERERKEKSLSGRIKYREKPRRANSQSGERRRKTRVVSGPLLEEARSRRGSFSIDGAHQKRKRRIIIGAIVVALLLIIIIPVGVLVVGKQSNNNASASDSSSGGNLGGLSENNIPTAAKGGYLDPFTWYDTVDFNVTYTNETVGGLPLMGLNSTWDDTVQANQYVPPLNETFNYGTMPIRGINVGGWLSIEPFITPSLFNGYDPVLGIIDEYTLTQHLGPSAAQQTIEKHYSTFITRQSFAEIQAAGFDHVRIPFSYWAVTTYAGDPYVPKISWRYLLRGIEYARQFGLRVNLDLHGAPGSQNGWNHSGRQGTVGWLNGTDGTLNAQRTLEIHAQLAQFFAQDRYKNVVGIYGLLNEPKMISLPTQAVVDWTTSAVQVVRKNGITQTIAFGDGFLGLTNWQGRLTGIPGLVLDTHEYVIFNVGQIAYNHETKLNFACSGWAGQIKTSMNTATGFGPTLCGEWSQADTDCATYLNNVGVGSRWEGTLNLGDPSLNVMVPSCPSQATASSSSRCTCAPANADPSTYTAAYKQWLLYNADAQMNSFEQGWGWFYWTWLTESSTQWSWKLGMEAGILPDKVWDRAFNCTAAMPAFDGLPETY